MGALHELLDWNYGNEPESELRRLLAAGADPEERHGPADETALHVAARRYRLGATAILLDHGADVNARTRGGKTAWAHAVRRGFNDLAELLERRGADTSLTAADRFAVAVVAGRLEEARGLLAEDPAVVRTGNPEEDRLLADVAGRSATEPVRLLIEAGSDLACPGLDDGTPLHQAAWFGQPANARLLVEAGAPLDVFDGVHESSPIGWAAHGSRYSGGAADRQDAYVEVARILLAAGASLRYPDEADGGGKYMARLLEDASEPVARLLAEAR